MWEFVLNNKYHKVEIFNSKMSGKKKLCLDAQVLNESKSYGNEYTYSFKIDKNYFNLIQSGTDKFELRIDNKSFQTLIHEEKAGEKNEAKEMKAKDDFAEEFSSPTKNPRNSKGFENGKSRASVFNPRNNNDDFFNDQNFDFDDNNTEKERNRRRSVGAVTRTNNVNNNNNFSNFNEINNKFSIPAKISNVNNARGSLIDMNEFVEKPKEVQTHNRKSSNLSMEQVRQNQNIISSININPVEESSADFNMNAFHKPSGGNFSDFDNNGFANMGNNFSYGNNNNNNNVNNSTANMNNFSNLNFGNLNFSVDTNTNPISNSLIEVNPKQDVNKNDGNNNEFKVN